jgi:putative membrane protein
MLRIALATLHLIALGLGLGAVLARGTALREGSTAIRRAFKADTMWGIAAGLWVATGVWRLFGETEKGVGYYMQNHAFYAKMGFFLIILALEISPMVTLIRWRRAIARGESAETVASPDAARRIATISHVEALLVVCMVVAATAMARGYGAR